jgi:outer membrane immunogenic protein
MKQLNLLIAALFTSCLLALTAVAGPEALPSGKEMKEVAPAPVPTCDFSWTGFYLGANVGYGWGNADTRFDPLPDPVTFFDLEPQTHDAEPDGVIGGGQIGFNWELSKWFIIGAEADFQGSDIDGSRTTSPVADITGGIPVTETFSAISTHERIDWFGTFRGKIGFSPWCRLLVYGTGGLAYANVHYRGDDFFVFTGGTGFTEPASRNSTEVGWTAGGGLEYALTRHWSIKAEYLYYDLGDHGATGNEFTLTGAPAPPFGIHYNWETTGNIVRGGINYKF